MHASCWPCCHLRLSGWCSAIQAGDQTPLEKANWMHAFLSFRCRVHPLERHLRERPLATPRWPTWRILQPQRRPTLQVVTSEWNKHIPLQHSLAPSTSLMMHLASLISLTHSPYICSISFTFILPKACVLLLYWVNSLIYLSISINNTNYFTFNQFSSGLWGNQEKEWLKSEVMVVVDSASWSDPCLLMIELTFCVQYADYNRFRSEHLYIQKIDSTKILEEAYSTYSKYT